MTKEVLALDIDDVVVKHVEGFIAWSNEVWGTNLTTADYSELWQEMWDVDPEECERRKRMFFVDEIIGSFEVIEGASEAITALATAKSIFGVTSRRESLKAVTEQALEIIAPGVVNRIIFATFFRDGEKHTRSKAEICIEIGANDLLDDQLKHCLSVANVGVGAVLFGDYDWQQPNPDLPAAVVRAKNWAEVLDHFGVPLS